MSEFIWVPSYSSAVTTKPTVETAKYGDGYAQRVAVGINNRARKWEVTFANRPSDTADAIDAFLSAANGVASFDWTPPHGSAGKWICAEWKDQKTGPSTRTISGTFEEIFGD